MRIYIYIYIYAHCSASPLPPLLLQTVSSLERALPRLRWKCRCVRARACARVCVCVFACVLLCWCECECFCVCVHAASSHLLIQACIAAAADLAANHFYPFPPLDGLNRAARIRAIFHWLEREVLKIGASTLFPTPNTLKCHRSRRVSWC